MQHTKKIVLALSLTAGLAHAQMSPVNSVTVSPTLGSPAWATAPGAIAVGSNAIAGPTQSGGLPTLTIAPNWAYADQTAVGTSALAWGQSDSAFGFGAVAVSNPLPGTTAAATALGGSSSAWGDNSLAVGYSARAGSTGGAPTSVPGVSNATALGGQANASANNSTAVGANASASGVNSVALGAGSVATRANSVEVGNRQITGVAAGTQTTDAVNMGQLQAAIAGVGGIDAGAIINQANAYTDQAINAVRREYSRAIAAVAASPMLPALSPGERAIAVGGGFYNGQQSLGITYGQAMSNGALLNAGVSTAGSGKAVARVGAAWKF